MQYFHYLWHFTTGFSEQKCLEKLKSNRCENESFAQY